MMAAKWLWIGLLGLVSVSFGERSVFANYEDFGSEKEFNMSCQSGPTDIRGVTLPFDFVADISLKPLFGRMNTFGFSEVDMYMTKNGSSIPHKAKITSDFNDPNEEAYIKGWRRDIDEQIDEWYELNKKYTFSKKKLISAGGILGPQEGYVIPRAYGTIGEGTIGERGLLLGYSNANHRFLDSEKLEYFVKVTHLFVFGKYGSLLWIVDLKCREQSFYAPRMPY